MAYHHSNPERESDPDVDDVTKLAEWRDENGKFQAFGWPGGYPILYVVDDGEVLCPACANRENGSEASVNAMPRSGWLLVGALIFYEGAPEACAHCGKLVESAYGEVEP